MTQIWILRAVTQIFGDGYKRSGLRGGGRHLCKKRDYVVAAAAMQKWKWRQEEGSDETRIVSRVYLWNKRSMQMACVPRLGVRGWMKH